MRFYSKGIVSIWAGYFADEEDLLDYVEWHYSDDNEDSYNAFAEHSRIRWFDHDFQEANFIGKLQGSWQTVLHSHSYGHSFADSAAAALEAQWQLNWNSLFILYDCDYQPERAHPSKDTRLHFIGSFEYEK